MSEMIELNEVRVPGVGAVKSFDRPIEIADLDDISADYDMARYLPYCIRDASGAKQPGDRLFSKNFPFSGDVEIVQYNGAKGE